MVGQTEMPFGTRVDPEQSHVRVCYVIWWSSPKIMDYVLLPWIELKLLKISSNVGAVLASQYDLKTPYLEARRCCILGQAERIELVFGSVATLS